MWNCTNADDLGHRNSSNLQNVIRRLGCWCGLVGLIGFAVSGCDRTGYQVVPVSGKVTLNGKPVGGLIVSFQPIAIGNSIEAGPGSYAWTDQSGNYTLALVSSKNSAGAVVGKHRVRLSSPLADQNPNDDRIPRSSKPLLPAQHDGALIEFEVPAKGTDKADFALTAI